MILVTGASGLVGGNLMWFLLQENERVSAIRRKTTDLKPLRTIFSFYTPNPDEYLARIDWKTADVLDVESLKAAMKNIRIVYHCAALVSLGNSGDIQYDTNVRGTKNVVNVALQNEIQKLCFVSSIAACGREIGGKYIDEKTAWKDHPKQSLYSRSKYFSELEVWTGIDNGLNAVIVNPGVILGVSGTSTGSSQMFSQVRKGLMFYTHGGSGYVDVRDVTKAMILLTKSEILGDRFVLVGENCSNKDVLSWMAEGFGKRRPFIGVGPKTLLIIGVFSEFLGKLFHFKPLIDAGTARSATNREYYSSQKIENAINFEFTSIQECIREVCEFGK